MDDIIMVGANQSKTKMIVTDLDNTLLRRDKTVSDYTSSVFKRCSDAGIKVVFATARPVRAVKWLEHMNINYDAGAFHNGAVIHIGGEPYKEFGIEYDKMYKLLKSASKIKDMKISAEINDVLYANFDTSTVWQGVECVMTDFNDLPNRCADKIIFGTADESMINIIEQLLGDDLYWEISDNEILMVMNKNARKINAVKEIADHYGFTLAETVAFGDDYNDMEMLRDCGIGVAVANAIDECKAVSKYICDDCDEDGVAKWLEEILFIDNNCCG